MTPIAVTGAVCSLWVDGRVAMSGTLSVDDLLRMSTPLAHVGAAVAVIDVLAGAQVSGAADVVVLSSRGCRPIAVPLAAVTRWPFLHLVVETGPSGVRIVLDAPEWTDSVAPYPVERITALTFAEFVLSS